MAPKVHNEATRLAVGVAILLTAAPARAYRPFDSTDATVAEHGDLELELGSVGYIHSDARGHFAPLEVLNLGIIEGWELVLQGRPVSPPEDAGASPRISLDDTGAFLKGILREGNLQGGSGVSIATEIGPLLPTVNGEPGWGVSADFILSDRFAFGTFHLDVQGARTRAGNGDLFAGVIIEGPYSWWLRPVAELYAEEELDAHTTFSALGGLIARVSSDLALDLGSRVATVDRAGLFEVRAGFTWAIPVWR